MSGIVGFLFCVIIVFIVSVVITKINDCNHELWLDNDYSHQGKQINRLIESPSDSIIVVDVSKLEPIGALYFKPRSR